MATQEEGALFAGETAYLRQHGASVSLFAWSRYFRRHGARIARALDVVRTVRHARVPFRAICLFFGPALVGVLQKICSDPGQIKQAFHVEMPCVQCRQCWPQDTGRVKRRNLHAVVRPLVTKLVQSLVFIGARLAPKESMLRTVWGDAARS